jgi:hypothetical protein
MGKPKAPPPPDYAGLAAQQGQVNKDTSMFDAGMNRPTEVDPYGSRTWTLRPGADAKNPQPGDWTVNTSLNPQEQQLLDSDRRISSQFGQIAEGSLGRLGDMMGSGLDLSGAPGLQTASTQGLPELAGNSDATRQRVEQALMSRMRPELDRQRQAMDTRLLTSGHDLGSAGWNTGMGLQSQAENDAMMQAILAGGQEESRLLGEQRATRGQLFNEGMDTAGFNNTARQQAIAEILQQRALPFNEANALRTGQQIGTFNPAQFSQSQTGAPPLFDAGLAQGNYDLAASQSKQSGFNSLLGGLAQMGGAAITRYSDRRLKTNIRQIGEKWGFPWYTWDWKDGTGSSEGVMADEVEAVLPQAVVQFGEFKAVHYHMLEARNGLPQ